MRNVCAKTIAWDTLCVNARCFSLDLHCPLNIAILSVHLSCVSVMYYTEAQIPARVDIVTSDFVCLLVIGL